MVYSAKFNVSSAKAIYHLPELHSIMILFDTEYESIVENTMNANFTNYKINTDTMTGCVEYAHTALLW
jgi:hypothetical protein